MIQDDPGLDRLMSYSVGWASLVGFSVLYQKECDEERNYLHVHN